MGGYEGVETGSKIGIEVNVGVGKGKRGDWKLNRRGEAGQN